VTERLSMSHRVVLIDMSMFTFEVMFPALTMRGCIMDEDRVITKTIRGIFVLSGSSDSFILLKLEPIFIMNKVFIFCKTFVDINQCNSPL
jgi:hypothetical protein